MKKLMIAAFVIAMAAVAQAGTVTWGSGTLYPAASATGGWNNTDVTKTIKALEQEVFMDVYFIDSTSLATYQGKTQEALYNEFSSKTADLSGSSLVSGVYGTAVSVKDETATGAQTGVVIAHYHDDALGKDFYIATAAQSSWSGSTSKGSAGNLISNKQSSVSGWQVANVPEPTSAMLLLLGVAGLALRRRCA